MSGSDKRKRGRLVQFRVDETEFAALQAAAQAARLPLGSYSRKILLDAPPARVRRRPSPEMSALAKLLGELGKIGSNLNQIAYWHNAGKVEGVSPGELRFALMALLALRDDIIAALRPEAGA